jgi:hypothetical protein
VTLIGVIDLEDNPSAEAMADALIWTLTARARLNIKNLICFCTDNTSSMSGCGIIGGCCDIIRRSFDLPELVPRMPCVLHSFHIGIANARKYTYFGELPSKLDRQKQYAQQSLLLQPCTHELVCADIYGTTCGPCTGYLVRSTPPSIPGNGKS